MICRKAPEAQMYEKNHILRTYSLLLAELPLLWFNFNMTPKEENLIATLNLLLLLYRAQKLSLLAVTEEQKHTLKVTKEHIALAGLTVPVFVNTIEILGKKGYLMAVSIFEEKLHAGMQEFYGTDQYQELIEVLKEKGNNSINTKARESIADAFEKIMPANVEFDREGFMKEEITLGDMLIGAKPLFDNHSSNDVSTIILMPFRSIERLLEKMNDGMKFDEVQDAGIWYQPEKYLFHIGEEEPISTFYNSKPTRAHFALAALMCKSEETRIDYVDIPEFDDTKSKEIEKKAYRDSLNGFIDKHHKLRDIFTAHSDHLEIHKEYLEHSH